MKYSIILPVRNGGKYVKECVQSILSQTVSCFNLHVLDNQSTDGTLEWIKSLNDNRIKIYSSEKPLTIEENWARIIHIPKNKFITIIGHDDILDPNYLKVMDTLIQKYPDASLYQAHFRYINSEGKIIRKCRPVQEIQAIQEFLTSILSQTLDTMGTGYMMRASDYDAIGGIRRYPNLLFADHELWIKLTSISYKATAPDECFSYRVHQSVSRVAVAVKYIQAFFKFMDFLKSLKQSNIEVNEVITKYIIDYIKYYCRSLAHRLLRTPESQRNGLSVAAFIKQCKKYADDLAPGNGFYPYNHFNIRFAKQIDSNMLSRRLYLLFKKVYRKPIYS